MKCHKNHQIANKDIAQQKKEGLVRKKRKHPKNQFITGIFPKVSTTPQLCDSRSMNRTTEETPK